MVLDMNLLELNRLGSDFVNITGWLTMALTLGWFVMSIFYLGVYVLWVPQEDLRDLMGVLNDDGLLPLALPSFVDHLVQYFVSAIAFAPVLFYSSLELLRRKPWARVFFVVAIGASVVANLLPVVALATYPQVLIPPIALQEDPMLGVRFLLALLIVVLSVLLVLMMVKLNSAQIRAEFRQAAPRSG
jgi:hypothetical protein